MTQELFLPVLRSFENNNIFTGSHGALRFKVTPSVVKDGSNELDVQNSSMRCECWYGLFCYEKSEIEAEATFPITDDGREAMRVWLMQQIRE